MNLENQERDASDREADLYERKFHRELVWKLSGTGVVFTVLAIWLRASVIWLLIMGGLSIAFYARAWVHRRKAQAVEARIGQGGAS